MIETVLAFWMIWKFEILVAAFLVALPFLKKHYSNNAVVAQFIQITTDRIATALEAKAIDDETGKKPSTKRSARKKRRRDVRTKLAKEARRQNRGDK
jgi:hypothetical protein